MTSKTATFFGSGPVAAKSLELMLAWLDIEVIVTKSTPSHHKDPAPVEELAKKHKIPILYASKKTELDTLLLNRDLPSTQFGIVIDYGVIISQQVIDFYPYGIINSHFSMLPEWRGADPITFSLLSGQDITGVCLMQIDAGMDTGPIIACDTIPIEPQDNNASLTDRLINLSNRLLKTNLNSYLEQSIAPSAQPNNIATYSIMLNKSDGIIDTNKSASVVAREIRAYNPWPGSRILLGDLWLTILDAKMSTDASVPSGKLKVENKQLYLGCKSDSLQILELKPAGKNKMSATAFINGYAHLLK